MKWLKVAVGLVLSTQALSALSLSDAVQSGLAKNPKIHAAQSNRDQARGLTLQAFGALAPEMTVTGSSLRRQDAQTSSFARFNGEAYNVHEVTARATIPLIQRGLLNGVSAVRLKERISELNLQIAARDLSLEIIEAYFSLMLVGHELEVLEKSKRVREQSLAIAKKRSRIGRGAPLEVLQIETQIALLEPRIQRARNEQKSSAANLLILIGLDRGSTVKLTTNVLEKPDAESYMKRLTEDISDLPELERARLNVEAVSLENSVSMSKHWPKLTGNAEVSRSAYGFNGLTNSDANEWQVGLTLEIPLVKGGFSYFENRTLDAALREAYADERKEVDSVERARISASEELKSSKAVIESSQKAVQLAEASVTLARSDFRTSTIDVLQLLNTEQSLLDAELALDQARNDLIQKLSAWTKVNAASATALVEFLSH